MRSDFAAVRLGSGTIVLSAAGHRRRPVLDPSCIWARIPPPLGRSLSVWPCRRLRGNHDLRAKREHHCMHYALCDIHVSPPCRACRDAPVGTSAASWRPCLQRDCICTYHPHQHPLPYVHAPPHRARTNAPAVKTTHLCCPRPCCPPSRPSRPRQAQMRAFGGVLRRGSIPHGRHGLPPRAPSGGGA